MNIVTTKQFWKLVQDQIFRLYKNTKNTISKDPLMTPTNKLEYHKLLCPSGNSTKSANGFESKSKENSSPVAFQFATCGVIPKKVLNPC